MQKLLLWLDKTWSRLLLASLACGIGLFITMGFLMDGFEKKVYETRHLELQRMTEMALNTIRPILEQQKTGGLTKEEALTEVRAIVRRMVFRDIYGYNYIFMSSYEGIMLVQPFEPAIEGTNQKSLRDAYGLPIIEALIEKAQQGGGFVTYYYHPPQRPEPQQKISYVMAIPELGVYIGSGMYVDDIRTSNRQFLGSLLGVCLFAFTLILSIQYTSLHPMFRSYRMLTDAFSRLKSHFDPKTRLPVAGYHKGSEAENLLTGFNQLLSDIEHKTEALRQNEMKFRTLFNFANDAILIMHDEVIVDCNYHTELLFGLPRNEIIGSKPGILSPAYQNDGRPSIQKAENIIRTVLHGQPAVFEWRHIRGESEFIAEVSLSRFDIEGDAFLLAILRDITERKEAEARLQDVHEELLASHNELEKNNRELKAQEEQIRHLAYHDTLTGLPNRRLFTEMLQGELEQANKGINTGAVLFFDLDNFKMINDSCGHAAGDQVLIGVAQDLINVFGYKHMIARFGGDEFVVLLDDLHDIEEIESYAARILQLVKKQVSFCGHRFQLSASMGIVLYPQDGKDVDEVLKNADTALYAVKNSGKNAWQYYSPAMQAAMVQRLSMEQSLRDALDNEEFALYFQPIVNAGDGKIRGFEALLRWQPANHGMISPLTFIPIAEECGLIVPIGNWVLKRACLFALRLLERGYADVFVAVNISVKQLTQPDFVSTVRMLLAESGLPPGCLELEITETVLMNSVEENVEKLLELKRLGVRLALDDFGTGYSSLTYLKKLPIQVLKIDKSFVDDLTSGDKTSGMIGSIIQLSHRLGLQVVAEGVETYEQQLRLQDYNCDMIQGYLISRPISEADTLSLLEEY